MWKQHHQVVLDRFANKFGLPALDGESARAWTRKLAEQFKYTFPDEEWGTKRASDTRPPSTDVICTRNPFWGYDVIKDQGTSHQSLNNLVGHPPERYDGQVYIEVRPINHIGDIKPEEPKPPVLTKTPWDRGEMLVMLRMLNQMYKVELKREAGLWINGEPDFEGIAAWGLDVYQNQRLQGKSPEQSMQEVLKNIRNSDEWRQKNR